MTESAGRVNQALHGEVRRHTVQSVMEKLWTILHILLRVVHTSVAFRTLSKVSHLNRCSAYFLVKFYAPKTPAENKEPLFPPSLCMTNPRHLPQEALKK